MFEVLEPMDPRWDGLAALAGNDVHYLSGYARVHERDDAMARLLVYSQGGETVIEPVLIRLIGDGPHVDLTNLYGYGGPVGSRDLMEDFWEGKRVWARGLKAVSEFTVLHPLLGNLFIPEGARQPKEIVTVDLRYDDRQLLDRMRNTRRHSIVRAMRSDILADQVSLTDKNIEAFYGLYSDTMDRVGASMRWILPLHYFLGYHTHLGDQTRLFFGWAFDQLETAALVIGSGRSAYYHFAGNLMGDRRRAGVNDLVVYEAMRRMRDAGFAQLHLGGGPTSAPNDSVLSYKAGFSTIRLPIFTNFSVFDPATYSRLSLETARTIGAERFGSMDFEPAYRRAAA